MSNSILFDAVLFDLDGTLVATDGFWVAAARAGARRAFAELGLDRPLPDADAWLAMVGLPLAQGFANVFPELEPAQRDRIMACCVEEEELAVRSGQAALFPGARELLVELRRRGLKLGIASNCSQGYLTRMLEDLELGELVDAARCLDSPGIHSKSDMLRDLLRAFGTHAAVMVGDRAADAEAAHDNALPHVHVAQGFAPKGERIECEAVVPDLRGVTSVLLHRASWIERVLISSGAIDSDLKYLRAKRIGVTGRTAAGKSAFAKSAARLLAEKKFPAAVVDLEDFRRSGAPSSPSAHDVSPAESALAAFDFERLVAEILAPHARGEPVRIGAAATPVPPETALFVDGLFLLHPLVRRALDRVIYLEVSESTSLKRVAAGTEDPEVLMRIRRSALPIERGFDELFEPRSRADFVASGENPLGERRPPAA